MLLEKTYSKTSYPQNKISLKSNTTLEIHQKRSVLKVFSVLYIFVDKIKTNFTMQLNLLTLNLPANIQITSY